MAAPTSPRRSRRLPPLRAAGALAVLLLALAVTASAVVGAVRSHTPSPLEREPEEVASDAVPRLAFLRSALDGGAGEDMQALFPEGHFFTHALYGLARANTGTLDPALRDGALREARWALERLEGPAGTAPFPAGADPRYGVFHAGWSTYLRVRVVELAGGPDAAPEEAERLEEDTAELRAAFAASLDRGTPYLEAYPGQAWPVDSVVAAAALARDGRVRGTGAHDAVLAAWQEAVQEHTDPATGLIPHRADAATGAPAEGARGSSQALLLRFLPDIDPAWAARDRAAFQEDFASPHGPLPGVREHPRGDDSPGDVDSGPLILGLSASASTVALGDAVVYGDTGTAAALTGFAEALGLPAETGGHRRYLGGLLPVGDAFLVWSLTAGGGHPEPVPPPDGAAPSAQAPPAWWRAPWYALAALVTAAAWWAAWRTARPLVPARVRPLIRARGRAQPPQ